MSLELPMYGLIAGLAYVRLRRNIYVSLVIAMVFGRLMFGLGLFVLGLMMDLPYTAAAFFSLCAANNNALVAMGVAAGVGILSCLAWSVVFLPALLGQRAYKRSH